MDSKSWVGNFTDLNDSLNLAIVEIKTPGFVDKNIDENYPLNPGY